MKSFILATGVALLMVGCGDSAPECSDSDVKDLVLDISKQETKRQAVPDILYNSLQSSAKRGEDGAKDTLQHYDTILERIDNMTIVSIRTESIDEKTKKSTCKAQLAFTNGKTHDISYTAQTTSEGELFAEVYGLQ